MKNIIIMLFFVIATSTFAQTPRVNLYSASELRHRFELSTVPESYEQLFQLAKEYKCTQEKIDSEALRSEIQFSFGLAYQNGDLKIEDGNEGLNIGHAWVGKKLDFAPALRLSTVAGDSGMMRLAMSYRVEKTGALLFEILGDKNGLPKIKTMSPISNFLGSSGRAIIYGVCYPGDQQKH
jgi:hypothetical protein